MSLLLWSSDDAVDILKRRAFSSGDRIFTAFHGPFTDHATSHALQPAIYDQAHHRKMTGCMSNRCPCCFGLRGSPSLPVVASDSDDEGLDLPPPPPPPPGLAYDQPRVLSSLRCAPHPPTHTHTARTVFPSFNAGPCSMSSNTTVRITSGL